jgi:CDP-glucose 4,6-dehydratase
MGVVTLLDAIRQSPSVQSCVIVTSDKCYRNDEKSRRFRESDPMGGLDPYSASKGAAELAATSMRHSFFAPYASAGHPARIATARAGNVIGGGDWSEDRLIPDIVRGCLGPDGRVVIRAPNSVRPWQHVLEPLRGYLMLAEHLEQGTSDGGWNFGPDQDDTRPVIDVANALVDALGQGQIDIQQNPDAPHEAKLLQLDSSKARKIGWKPGLDFNQTIDMTAGWYGEWAKGAQPRDLCLAQIEQYMNNFGEKI